MKCKVALAHSLLQVLRARYKEFQWCGREKGKGFLGLKGTFVMHTAHVNGFEIRISVHDYRGQNYPSGVPEGIRWRRDLPQNARQWIEVSIADELTRYGRRSVLNREVFLPGTTEYAELKEIFEEICKVGIFFNPRTSNRLSSEQALKGFCRSLSTKSSP